MIVAYGTAISTTICSNGGMTLNGNYDGIYDKPFANAIATTVYAGGWKGVVSDGTANSTKGKDDGSMKVDNGNENSKEKRYHRSKIYCIL